MFQAGSCEFRASRIENRRHNPQDRDKARCNIDRGLSLPRLSRIIVRIHFWNLFHIVLIVSSSYPQRNTTNEQNTDLLNFSVYMAHSFTLSPHPLLPFRLEPSTSKTTSDKHIYIHGLYLGGTRAYINRYTKSILPTNFQSREFILSIARLIGQTQSINE